MAVERDPSTLPSPQDPSGLCPRCGYRSNFQVLDRTILEERTREEVDATYLDQEVINVLLCAGCHAGTVVVSQNAGGTQETIHVFPAPGAATLDPGVPADVASAYDEGQRCRSIGANRAAAVMFRSALTLFVKDKGDEKAKNERHLKTALKHMKSSGHLHPSLSDWADHLNQLGNEGAHPEDYDDVTTEEARHLGDFVQHLIKSEYEMPAQLLRARGLAPKHSTRQGADYPGMSGPELGMPTPDSFGTPLT